MQQLSLRILQRIWKPCSKTFCWFCDHYIYEYKNGVDTHLIFHSPKHKNVVEDSWLHMTKSSQILLSFGSASPILLNLTAKHSGVPGCLLRLYLSQGSSPRSSVSGSSLPFLGSQGAEKLLFNSIKANSRMKWIGMPLFWRGCGTWCDLQRLPLPSIPLPLDHQPPRLLGISTCRAWQEWPVNVSLWALPSSLALAPVLPAASLATIFTFWGSWWSDVAENNIKN